MMSRSRIETRERRGYIIVRVTLLDDCKIVLQYLGANVRSTNLRIQIR